MIGFALALLGIGFFVGAVTTLISQTVAGILAIVALALVLVESFKPPVYTSTAGLTLFTPMYGFILGVGITICLRMIYG